MKAVTITLAGRERHLAFTVEAMFQIEEQFGGTGQLLEAMQRGGREGTAAACRAAALLAEQGELGRRALGYDPQPMTDAEAVAATLSPGEAAGLSMAVVAAVSLGYGREVDEANGEVDLGLAELNAQKKTG